jgi:hypothetical protein
MKIALMQFLSAGCGKSAVLPCLLLLLRIAAMSSGRAFQAAFKRVLMPDA